MSAELLAAENADAEAGAALIREFPEAFAPYRMAIRIAALETQIERLTAPVTEAEAADLAGTHDFDMVNEMRRGLTAFLERRMKG